MFEAGEPDQGQRLARTRVGLASRPTLHAQAEAHVSEDVAVREQRVVLEHQSETAPVRRYTCEVVAVPAHDAGRLGREPGHRTEQRALAAPARSEDADDLAVADRQVDVVERDHVAVAHRELLDTQHRTQNSPTVPKRSRSMATIASAVSTMRITLAAIAAPKLSGPGRPSNR